MNDSSLKKCPTCGAPLEADSLSGCPRCLMLAALQPTRHTDGAERPPAPTLAAVSAAFPQLEVLELIGQGGMGCVFKARQPQLNRFVALKILPEALSGDAAFAARFTREAQALAALNHPNIVTIHDFGFAPTTPRMPDAGGQMPDAKSQTPGFYYLLMEFVDGVNLRQLLQARKLAPEEALAIVPPLCDALQFAHERGIVHRDIKPANLLLDKNGRIKVADFGIAKMLAASGAAASQPPDPGAATNSAAGKPPLPSFLTADNATAGTPGYMAPEQKATPQKVDSRADIYSLGVVLYEMLTGELPADKLQPPSRKVQIDVRLDEIVLRALEKTPELRYQTAAELRTQVETMVGTPPPSGSDPAGPTGTKVISPRFLKVGTSTLTTPARLATVSGQLFHYRTRGQLVLDDRLLTHSRAGTNTVIPLAAIRDVSIGQYPRSMNPVGIDLLSVTYEEGGQRKQVLLSPMEGWFAMPSTWDARVAEWATAIREAATAATGRAPTTTPSEKLGVPGSLVALLTLILMPLVLLGVFLACLTMLSSPGASRHNTGLMSLFIFGMAALGFFLLSLQRRRAKSPPGSARALSPWRIVFGVVALSAVLFGLSALVFLIPSKSASGVTQFDIAPVGVSNNVVIVDVTTEVGRGNAELRAVLDGPPLPAGTEAALQNAFSPAFAGTFVKPTPHAGNHPWRLLAAGSRQTWRLGFVLPNAALAKEAFDDLRPMGHLPAVAGRTHAGILFELGQPGAETYSARLQVTPPVASNDPNWVSAWAMTTYNESSVRMNWEVEASQPGTVLFQREGSRSTAALKRDAKTELHQTSVSLELTKIGTNRVLLVSRIGGVTAREELSGNFRDLSAELLRFKNMSVKTVRGAEIELCQFQGKPVTVQVQIPTSAITPPATATSPAIQRVEISQDKAVVHQARYDGSGLLITFGTGTNRWTPSGRYLDGLFNVTLEWPWFGKGALRVIKPRHGIHMNYRLDGPPGPMVGKLVFHPGTARPDAEGLCVIGEFQPDTGEPLPIAVEFVPDQATAPRSASTHPSATSKSYPAPVKVVNWSVPFYGVIGLCVIGGIVLIMMVARKGGNVGKLVALLCIVPLLLLAVSLVWYSAARARRATDEAQRAMAAARAELEAKAGLSRTPTLATNAPVGPAANFFVRDLEVKNQHTLAATFEVTMPAAPPWVEASGSLPGGSNTVTRMHYQGQLRGAENKWLLHAEWDFKNGFDESHARSAMNQLQANWRQREGDIPRGGRTELFSVTNGTGELLSGHLRYDERPGGPSTITFAVPTKLAVGVPWFTLLAGFVILVIIGAGLVLLLVVLLRKRGSSAGKVIAVLLGVGLLLMGLFFASLVLWYFARSSYQAAAQPVTSASPAPAGAALAPAHIEFKVLRVENPPGTRDILLHFERDKNPGLGLEVSQDVTPSDGLRKQPTPGTYRDWQVKTWVGVNDRVLGWTLPQEFTAAEVRAVAKDLERRAKTFRLLPDGAVPEFATAVHRDGWKYHLFARVLRAPGLANPPLQQPAPVPLIRREVKQANPGGKDLVMTFEELQRDEKTSIATVKSVGGGSVGSAMFIARGAYDIARARGAAYFINLKSWQGENGEWMSLIGFASDKNVDPKTYFDLKEPMPADKQLLFLSVSAYERIFKDQP